MKEVRLANKIIVTLIKDRIHYPARLLVDTIAMVARCGILLILYWYVFNLNNGTINHTTFNVIAWSIFLYFVFSSLRLRDISRAIMKDVQSGNVEVLLNKPVSYILYKIWWQIGDGLYQFAMMTVLGSITLFFIIGVPETMKIALFLPTLFLVTIGAIILTLIVYAIVGVLAFWIEDIDPIFWIVDKAVMMLGGSYLPVALFPTIMYKIALYSPFGASQFMTHTVNESWASSWYTLIGIQIVWILILGIVLYAMYVEARKKISVNGG